MAVALLPHKAASSLPCTQQTTYTDEGGISIHLGSATGNGGPARLRFMLYTAD
jgi:hypothetical protein